MVHCTALHHHTWHLYSHVTDMLHRRRLRSASTEWLDVPTCRQSTVEGRAFLVAGAKVRNSLPSDVTSASSLAVINNRLKTYLFRCCYETVWLWMNFLLPVISSPPVQWSLQCVNYVGHSKDVSWWWWWWSSWLQKLSCWLKWHKVTAITPFYIIQGRQWKARMWLPISE